LNIDCLCSTCQVCQMTKKERKKYGLLPPKIAESDPWVMVCVDLVGPFTIRTPAKNTLSACTHNDGSRYQPLVCLKLLKPQISQQHPSSICLITPGWHVTRDLNLFSLTMGANSNVSSNKCVYKTIMALKQNKLQVTTIQPQANAIIERVHKVVNDMLRSFDLENENNHENLEEQEENPFDYFLQSTASAIRSTYHTTLQATPCQLVFGRDMIHNIAFRANWDQIQKRKQDIINKSNQKENKSQIPYEYKVGDQVLFETPGILRKLSTPRTGPYHVTNIYKNGTIRIQKGIVSERVNIRRITPFNQKPN
jgi:hypothetical protein